MSEGISALWIVASVMNCVQCEKIGLVEKIFIVFLILKMVPNSLLELKKSLLHMLHNSYNIKLFTAISCTVPSPCKAQSSTSYINCCDIQEIPEGKEILLKVRKSLQDI
jgi:hypothetical protein